MMEKTACLVNQDHLVLMERMETMANLDLRDVLDLREEMHTTERMEPLATLVRTVTTAHVEHLARME